MNFLMFKLVLEKAEEPGIKLTSQMSPALTGGFFTTNATWGSLGNTFVVGVSETGLSGAMEGLI